MGVKEYELPNGRKAVFEFDENGVGKITLEAMDLLLGLIKADLVKCKDCKWCEKKGGILWCNIWHDDTNGLNFCSYAERRADERITE